MGLRFEGRKASRVFVDLLSFIAEERGEAKSKAFAQAVRDEADAKIVSEQELPTYWLTETEIRRIATRFLVAA